VSQHIPISLSLVNHDNSGKHDTQIQIAVPHFAASEAGNRSYISPLQKQMILQDLDSGVTRKEILNRYGLKNYSKHLQDHKDSG